MAKFSMGRLFYNYFILFIQSLPELGHLLPFLDSNTFGAVISFLSRFPYLFLRYLSYSREVPRIPHYFPVHTLDQYGCQSAVALATEEIQATKYKWKLRHSSDRGLLKVSSSISFVWKKVPSVHASTPDDIKFP